MSNIKSLPSFEQPREKFIRKGFSYLTDTDLLALIISSGRKDQSAIDISRILLSQFNNSLRDMARSSHPELMRVNGIGEVTALKIAASFELGRRKDINNQPEEIKITSSEGAYMLLRPQMEDLTYEVFKIILLNRSNRVIKVIELSKGGVSGTVVDAKLVFKKALDHLASSIILCHNHPSGNLNPSEADKRLTKTLIKAGEVLSLKVIDHLIISYKGYYSFADEGLI